MASYPPEKQALLDTSDTADEDSVPNDSINTGETATIQEYPEIQPCDVQDHFPVITIEPVVFAYFLYASSLALLYQQYIYYYLAGQFSGGANTKPSSNCTLPGDGSQSDDVQRSAALWMTYFSAVGLPASLLSLPFFGHYCDTFGRKNVLLLPMIGSTARCFISIVIVSLNLPLQYFFIATIVDNLCGGFAIFLMATFSYLSDIISFENRAWRIIVIEVIISISAVTASVSMGFIVEQIGFLWPFHILLGINLFAILYTVAFIKESLPNSRSNKRVLSLEAVQHSITVYIRNDVPGRRWRLLTSVGLVFVIILGQFGRSDATILFLLGQPFCFNPIKLGLFNGFQVFIGAAGSLILTRVLQPVLSEMGLVIIGCISGILNVVIFGSSSTVWMICLAMIIGMPEKISVGMLRSYSSKLVEQHEFGAMFAGIAWCESVGIFLGVIVFNLIYQATVHIYRGLVFYIDAVWLLLPVFLSCALAILDLKRRNKFLPQPKVKIVAAP